MRLFGTVLAVLLAAFVVLRTDWSTVWTSLSAVSLVHLIGGVLLVQFQIVMSAIRWRFTAGRLGQSISIWRAIREYYISTGLNQLLPGGVAGDAIRAYRGRKHDGAGLGRAVTSVAFERLSGQAALLVFVIISVILWPSQIYGYNKLIVLACIVGAVGLAGAILSPILRAKTKGLAANIALAFWKKGAAFHQAVTSLLITASYIGLFGLCSQAVGSPLSPEAALIVVPICLLTMVLPSGFGGWGTREAAAAALWPLAGYASDQGIAASILYGVIAMVGAAPALLVLYPWRRSR